MIRSVRTGFVALAGLVVVLATLFSRPAAAYPQWQFSSGTARCNQCHFSPAGGGLITGYGRDAAGEELSTWEGDGGFLHGRAELPGWLALGADLRAAFTSHDAGDPEGARRAVFPMQTDFYGRAAFAGSWSIQATVGFRGQARKADLPTDPDNPQASGGKVVGLSGGMEILPVSREHYVMWRPQAVGPYVRAGRFFAPYGLRLAEHIMYVRRDQGFNLLGESYGVSGGVVKNEWELHVSAFLPDYALAIGGRDYGGAAMFEKRVGGASALGVSTRLAFREDQKTYSGGAFGKSYIEAAKLLLMAEGNLNLSQYPKAGNASTTGATAYFGATFFPFKGMWVSAFAERKQTSLTVKDTGTNAFGGQLNWFPLPHFEIVALGRAQAPAGTDPATKTLLIFVHYYL